MSMTFSEAQATAQNAESEINRILQNARESGMTEAELDIYKQRVVKRGVEILKATVLKVTGHEFGAVELTEEQFTECMQVMANYWEPIIAEQHAKNGTQPAPKTDRAAPTAPSRNLFGIRPEREEVSDVTRDLAWSTGKIGKSPH